MFHGHRPLGRFFCWIAIGMFLFTPTLRGIAVMAKTTRVTDTVYRADGSPAKGTILISWPAFTAASGEAVAGGRTTVTIGAAGQVDLPLVANTGSSPASYYTVVVKLDDGTTATEFWTVPATASTTIAAIRSKLVPAGVAAQMVGRDYVDTALTAKASDTAVVHYAGVETIGGAKTFTANPVVPTPTAGTHAANKSYVDAAVQSSIGNVLSATPNGSQVITQPNGTSLQVNRVDLTNVNGVRHADRFASIQAAITDAGTTGAVVIPPGYTGQDNFTNPNGRSIVDLRRLGDSRAGVISVKDFGARGDGGWYSQVTTTAGSGGISNFYLQGGRYPNVGETITIAGAGVAGADLTCVLSSAPSATVHMAACGGGVTASASGYHGARWGASVDDTPAFQAAINYCATAGSNGGCTVKVPSGVYFVSNLTFPALNGVATQGQVFLQGMGRESSWLIGIGANLTPILTAPANSVSTYVTGLGFTSYDYANKTQDAILWAGGQEHTFTNNYVSAVHNMVSAANTWINKIENNRCYGVVNCIEFGGAAGTGGVNATWVEHNEMAAFSGHAIYTHTNQSSWGNTYGPNSIENDNPPFSTPVYMSDNQSEFIEGYTELSPPTTGYYYEFHGSTTVVRAKALPCTWNASGSNIFFTNGGNGSYPCAGHSYYVVNSAGGNKFFGLSTTDVDVIKNADQFLAGISSTGAGNYLSGGALATYTNQPGTANDWPSGRTDLSGAPLGRSNSSLTNPSYPSQFGANAAVPPGSMIFNSYAGSNIANPRDNNLGWYCFGSLGKGGFQPGNCTVGSGGVSPTLMWGRWGEIYTRVKGEQSSAPSSGAHVVGDFYWNTNGATGIIGWYCTVAGTPGTWMPVYAIDPAAPPALGTTTPNTVKATTVNATTGYQVNGTALVSSCGSTTSCSNTAVGTARTVVGRVTLASGTATISGISPAFTSTSSYFCTCTDQATTPAACSIQNASTTSITVKGSGTDTINYQCIGN